MSKSFDAATLLSVAGRVVIVTGGGKGIGGVYCRRLAEAGAKVVVADIDEQANIDTVAAIRANGGEAAMATTDVSDEAAAREMVAETIEAFGRVDGLVNNASLMSVLPRGSWLDIGIERWDRVMAVNLRGIFLCCKAVFPHMAERGGGKIVNIASGRFWMGGPNRLDYSTSKAGVIGLTRSLASEVGQRNICVNAITPDSIRGVAVRQHGGPPLVISTGAVRSTAEWRNLIPTGQGGFSTSRYALRSK